MARINYREYLPVPHRMGRYRRVPYAIQYIDLSVARSNDLVPLRIPADTITVVGFYPGGTTVYLRLQHDDADPIPIQGVGQEISTFELNDVPLKVERIYLTHDALENGYLILGLGGEASVKISVGQTVVVRNFDTLLTYTEQIKDELLTGELQTAVTGNDLSSVLASTDTALAAGASWNTGWISVDRYGTLVFTLVTDVDIDVLIEWSWDGVNVDANESDTVTTALSPYGSEVRVKAPYCRITLTNGGTVDQTQMRFRMGGRVI